MNGVVVLFFHPHIMSPLLKFFQLDTLCFQVSPFVLIALLASAIGTKEDDLAAYPFVLCFLFLLIVWGAKLVLVIRSYGMIRKTLASAWAGIVSVAKLLFAVREKFAFKVFAGILALNLAIALPMLAYYQIDLPKFFRATYYFLLDIYHYILDAHLLIRAVRTWLQKTLLARVIDPVYTIFNWERAMIQKSLPHGLGAIAMISTPLALLVLLIVNWDNVVVSFTSLSASSMAAEKGKRGGRINVQREEQ
jgi:hypothetical protein